MVNDVPISKAEFDISVRQHESMNPQRYQAMTFDERERALSRVLNRMIMVRLRRRRCRTIKRTSEA
jgi:hypothetical protein